jgi:hypothetical protein
VRHAEDQETCEIKDEKDVLSCQIDENADADGESNKVCRGAVSQEDRWLSKSDLVSG